MLSDLSPARAARLALGALAAATVIACGQRDADSMDTTAAMDTTPAAATPVTPTFSDAQIVQIVVVANSADSAGGVAAKDKARHADVKDFAQMMIRDHGGANKQIWELTQRLSVTPEESDASRQLRSDADLAKTNISAKTAAEFDRAYMDQEVQFHAKVLDQLDMTLIPGVQNAELKSLLQSIRPVVAAHLERARTIQGTIVTAAGAN